MSKVIHIYIGGNKKQTKDANPDGTISKNEEAERKALVAKARKVFSDLKSEAYKIGGSFRGPGI